MNKQIEKFEITSGGERKVNHPAGFETITMLVKIESFNIVSTDSEIVLERIEAICPVLSMLDKGVKTTIKFKLNE